MPELLPFRALRYDASAVPDISAVLCPPYDIISETERRALADRDPLNAVHVELPRGYDEAATTFAQWQSDGCLRQDERAAIYVYEQSRGDDSGGRPTRGFFCRLRLEEYGTESGVRPHEHTMSGPKEDRFRLLSAVKANVSPVLFLYDDGTGGAAAHNAMEQIVQAAPVVEGMGPGGLLNRLWLADPGESEPARELLRLAGDRPVTIADGHHRYETALRYRREVGGGTSDQVLALMHEARSGGLALLPWHRVLNGVDPARLLEAASRFFTVRVRDSAAALMAAVVATPISIGLWTRDGGALLTIARDRVEPLLGSEASDTVRWLDVSVLSSTLSAMTGTSTEELAADGQLTYSSDARSAITQVDEAKADAAFLIRPTPIEDVLAVAAAGEFMPAKSTYFRPKAATGLVFNSLND